MYYTREQIRSFIRCPQLGSTDYGEWGALRLEQRLAINSMLDQLDSADAYIEKLYKENEKLKRWKRTAKQKYISITRLKQKQQEIIKESVYQKYDDEWDGTDCTLTPEEMYAHDILDDLIEEKVKQRWGNEDMNALYDLNEMLGDEYGNRN